MVQCYVAIGDVRGSTSIPTMVRFCEKNYSSRDYIENYKLLPTHSIQFEKVSVTSNKICASAT